MDKDRNRRVSSPENIKGQEEKAKRAAAWIYRHQQSAIEKRGREATQRNSKNPGQAREVPTT